MKKGLLSILAGALLVVGCQNYDDQFSSLESQINALASTVAGLSQVQSDLSALSGTVSSLSSTVASLGSSIDTAVSNGLADITADIAALQAAVADVASTSDVAALQAAIAAAQTDLDDLLANSSVFTGNVVINNSSTLDAFYAMGSTLAIVNGNVDIDVTTAMDITKVQAVVDNILTTTGHFDYQVNSTDVAGITFNNLSGVASLTLKQADGYELKNLVSALDITLMDTYATKVDIVHLGSLKNVSSISDSASHTIDFTSATEVHLTSLAYYAGGNLTINTKKGGVVDISALTDTNTAGVVTPFTLTINGPASVDISKIVGDAGAASASRGAISLTEVPTVKVSNFGGNITLGDGVVTATLEDVANDVTMTGATDLTTLSIEGVSDYGKTWSTAGTTAQAEALYTSNLLDVAVTSSNSDLEKITLTGKFNTVSIASAAALNTIVLNASIGDLDITGNADLTSVTTTGSTINDIYFYDNDAITALTLDYDLYTTVVSSSGTADAKGDLDVSGNAKLASLTVNTTKLNDLDIDNNAELATVSFPNLGATGIGTTPDVDIFANAFVASSITDSYDATAAGAAITTGVVDNSTNKGSVTTTSGLSSLKTWLDAVVAAGSTSSTSPLQVWFDTVTELKTADVNGTLTTSAPGTITQTAANAGSVGAIVYITSSVTSGRNTLQAVTAAIPLKRAVGAGNVLTALSSVDNTDDITIGDGTGATKTFTTGTATGEYATVDALIAAIDGDTTLSGVTVQADRDAFHEAEYQIVYTVTATGAAATFSDETRTTTGTVYFTFGTNPEVGGTISGVTAIITGASQGSTALASAIATKLNSVQSAYVATSTQYGTIQVVAQVSGTIEEDRGPHPHSFPTLYIDVASPSTTLLFAGSSSVYSTLSNASSNTTAIASSLFNLSVVKNLYSGIRVTLKNTSTTVAKTMTITFATAAQLSSALAGNGGDQSPTRLGMQALVAGTNVVAASVNSSTLDYVAGFSDIESTSSSTAATTDRTDWL